MKSVALPLVVAILVAAAGAVSWRHGRAERQIAETHRRLALMQFAATERAADNMAGTGNLPLVRGDDDAATDIRRVRATARYWTGAYDGVAPSRDAGERVTETDAQLLLVGANAAFRDAQRERDRTAAARRLDAVLRNYADVLKATGSLPDATYNYEFVARLRDGVQRGRPAVAPVLHQASIHGTSGAPPPNTDMNKFKIMIPRRSEERKEDDRAGKSPLKTRKG
jgi:hypothetical protein